MSGSRAIAATAAIAAAQRLRQAGREYGRRDDRHENGGWHRVERRFEPPSTFMKRMIANPPARVA